MSDSQYKIKLEIEKQSTATSNEEIKKFTESLNNLSKAMKPLSDNMSAAFSPKTLETLNKITAGFGNLERTVESLSRKMAQLGLSVKDTVGSNEFKEAKAAVGGGGGGDFTQTGARIGPPGGGGGGPTWESGAPVAGGGGGGWLSKMSTAGSIIGLGVAAAGAGISFDYERLARQRRIEIQQAQFERFGVQSAMSGNIADYMLGNLPITATEERRIKDAGRKAAIYETSKWAGIGGGLGMGVGALAAGVESFGIATPLGMKAGGLIGAGIGGAAAAYFQAPGAATEAEKLERQRVQTENLALNENFRLISQNIPSYMGARHSADRAYGADYVNQLMANSNNSIYRLEDRARFAGNIGRQGISIGSNANVSELMGVQDLYRAGGLQNIIGRATGQIGNESTDLILKMLGNQGLGGNDARTLAAREASTNYADQFVQQRGIIEGSSNVAGTIMGMTGEGLGRGLTSDAASRSGQRAFEMQTSIYGSNAGMELTLGGLSRLGLSTVQAMRVQRRLAEGNEQGAYILANSFNSGITKEAFGGVAGLPLEMTKRVQDAFGGAGALGDVFSDIDREAQKTLTAGGKDIQRGGPARPSAQSGQDQLNMAMSKMDTAISDMGSKMSDVVLPIMQKAAIMFSDTVNKQSTDILNRYKPMPNASDKPGPSTKK